MARRVLFLVNHEVVIYNFRLELVERFIADGHEVHISCPYGERMEELKALGAIHHDISIDGHGMNPVKELQLIKDYSELMRDVRPDMVFGYTIKPNIYGAIAARKEGIPFIANITGLGTAVENPGLKQKFFVLLYKYAFTNVKKVFFQNEENRQFFVDNRIAINRHGMLPGSGVDLSRFHITEYPDDEVIKFLFIARIMKEKGIDYYLEAASKIKAKYPNTEFHIGGYCEKEYSGRLNEFVDAGIVTYHGMIKDVAKFLQDTHCVVHPSYYPEGISNVLLESCACGRPIITTNRSGCREVVIDGTNGYMVPIKDSKALYDAIDRFINLTHEEKRQMGLNGRKFVEENYDRQIVVEAYVNELQAIN